MADIYDVVGISERTKLVPGAGFEDVEEITYKTKPAGVYGTVVVVKDQASPEYVDKIIRAEVERKHALKEL